jgi:flavocytochrome c
MKKADEKVDVLVVGSGFAGLAAAIEAAEAGASVLVVEKNRSTGGNSRISDGGIAACGTKLQRKFGYEDSRELFFQDVMASGMGINHPKLVRIMVDHSAEAFEWSRDVLQVPYMDRIDIFGGHSVHRCYTAEKISGSTIIEKQLEYLKALGVEVRTATRFEGFLTGPDGMIQGALLAPSGSTSSPASVAAVSEDTCQVQVERGIVLAAGGYGADIPFRSAQDPRLDASIDTTNRASATAEVLRSLLRLGAMPVQLSSIQLGPWASPDEKGYGHGPMFSEYIVFQYGLIVDPATGKRFVNELADRKRLSDAILSRGKPCIGIADSQAVTSSGWDISTALRKGVVKQYETLHALADSYGMDGRVLKETMENFDKAIEAGSDRDFGKPIIREAKPLAHAPFYAIRLWPKVHHVGGGVGIDGEARVLDLEGRPVPGLYAAGEICGGIHGANRLGSCAITECFVFGRIAGRNGAGMM